MKGKLSTRQVAKKLGRTLVTLQRHIAAGTLDAPPLQDIGGSKIRLWDDHDIAKAGKVLAGIKPGRKKQK